jgi:hypothetical protein
VALIEISSHNPQNKASSSSRRGRHPLAQQGWAVISG